MARSKKLSKMKPKSMSSLKQKVKILKGHAKHSSFSKIKKDLKE